MTCGVVIVSWNGESWLGQCLSSVVAQAAPPATIVVIDNASDDRSLEIVATFESSLLALGGRLIVVREENNTGFTRAANRGLNTLLASDTRVEFAVLLNQDAALDPGWIREAARVLNDDERIGVLGAKIHLPNGFTIQHAGGYIERPRMIGRHFAHHQPDQRPDLHQQREVEFVTAAAMAVRLDALRDVGVFAEIFSPGYYEDVDLCDRMRAASWKVMYSPALVARHAESISFGQRDDLRSLAHRNRLVYALPYLVDAALREAFSRAEREYFRSHPPLDDHRALALAYLSVLLGLRDAVAARVPRADRSRQLTEALVDMFTELRRELVEEGQRRAPIRVARHG
jgi:O-antigen biosynthesis protein